MRQPASLSKRGVAFVALLGVLMLYAMVSVAVVWPLVAPTRMAILAHRGDMTHWPENTLESVIAASRSAADGIEFDVGLSADGTWWLMHDQTLDKTTAASGAIGSHSDAELAALTIDGGPGYSGQKGVHLVRLSTVLQALGNYNGKLVMDVKENEAASHAGIAKISRAGRTHMSYVDPSREHPPSRRWTKT